MRIPPTRRVIAGITLGALAGFGLVSVPSPAHAAIDEAQSGGQYNIDGYNCDGENVWDEQDAVPWTDNNVTVSKSTSAAETFTGGEGDSVAATSSTSTSVTASPIGSGPATITGTATATSSTAASGDETECNVFVQSTAMTSGIFTLTKPMWATLTATGKGHREGQSYGTSLVGVGSVGAFGTSWEGLFALGGDGLTVSPGNRGTAVAGTLLPAGRYGVAFGSIAYAVTNDEFGEIASSDAPDGSASFTGSFRIDLSPLGAASAVTGKGASKVNFGARDCASGAIPVSLSKKTVKKAKRVTFKVRGAKATVLKGKKLVRKRPKAKTVVLPAPASSTTKVKVKLVLKNGRRMHATRSYLPCR